MAKVDELPRRKTRIKWTMFQGVQAVAAAAMAFWLGLEWGESLSTDVVMIFVVALNVTFVIRGYWLESRMWQGWGNLDGWKEAQVQIETDTAWMKASNDRMLRDLKGDMVQ